MKLDSQTRDILRQYKEQINRARREAGLRALRTEDVISEICDFMRCQPAVYIGGQYIRQDKR